MTSFVHLRCHTEYCINSSTLKISELLKAVAKDQQGAIAITDIDALFGSLRFYLKARSEGLQPIIGVDIGCYHPRLQTSSRLLLIAKNFHGYLALLHLLTKAHRHEHSTQSIEILLDWISPDSAAHLFCLMGGSTSLLSQASSLSPPSVPQDQYPLFQEIMSFKQLFGSQFFLEIQRSGRSSDADLIQTTLHYSEQLSLPLCATQPMFFMRQQDYLAHELRVCDKMGYILHDRKRPRLYTPYQHFLTQAEMQELFHDFPDALQNTVLIAQSCSLTIPLGKSVLPDYPVPAGQSLKDLLTTTSFQGLERRLLKLYPNPQERADRFPAYEHRLNHELQVISGMGFEGYFMIVQDFIGWAKSQNIPVGPGRGSGAGSLVAYALGITDLDPLLYQLLFERFLNPERVSMPDFDIDFCKEKRELVIEYVTQKYGPLAVSGIANINTLQARAAIKAAGRALGLRVPFVSSVSNLIPAQPGQDISIQSALDQEPELKNRVDSEPEVAKLIHMAQALEGLPTAIGQHAAGIVISPTVISDYAPLYLPEGKNQAVTQYDKDDIEKAGLVKFDFLGLKTLTEIQKAVDFIHLDLGQPDFDLESIPLNDPQVFSLFQKGDTHCIFQFESPGMQRLLIEAKPSCFADLVALNALYRPGPMDLIPDFIQRKSGLQPVHYLDPRLEPILSETYGIMVYQEQVMQIAQVIGGYTLGGADLLRRAMGKKKVEEMAQHRQIFSDGALKQGVPVDISCTLFDMMEKFAGYGFNKSHAAAYTLLAYQTAYIKHYFPQAFYASWLSIESAEDTAVLPSLIKDAKKHGVSVLAPCIQTSLASFSIQHQSLRYGLSGLKGLGMDKALAVVQERTLHGPYSDFQQLIHRLGPVLGKKGLEIACKAGALDSFHESREALMMMISDQLLYAKQCVKQQEKEQQYHEAFQVYQQDLSHYQATLTLMESIPSTMNDEDSSVQDDSPRRAKKTPAKKTGLPKAPKAPKPPKPLTPPLPPTGPFQQTLLDLLNDEREAFGFFFSKHPFEYYAPLLGGLRLCKPLNVVQSLKPDWSTHLVAGVVHDLRWIDTKTGQFLIITLGDGQAEIELKAFSSVNQQLTWVKKDQFFFAVLQTRPDHRNGGTSFMITDAMSFDRAQILLAEQAHVLLPPENLHTLKALIDRCPGSMPLFVWHPCDSLLLHCRTPYGYIAQDSPTFEAFKQSFGPHFSLSFYQSPPKSLL